MRHSVNEGDYFTSAEAMRLYERSFTERVQENAAQIAEMFKAAMQSADTEVLLRDFQITAEPSQAPIWWPYV
jgi:hypothetical protein